MNSRKRLEKALSAKTISHANTADLLEFDLGNGVVIRGLKVCWDDKHERGKQTIIPVPRTREQYASVDADAIPDNIDDAEQVRRWTLGLKPGHELIMET